MGAGDERGARRVGVREVAQRAGVSTQTVSRVINGHPSVRDDTRKRVQDAMAALGYRVNNAARSLGTRRTRTLGVLASDATLYGPSVGIAALEAAARAAGRWIATAYADADDAASVDEAMEHLLAQGVDGVILVAPHAHAAEALHRPGLPVVELHGGEGARRQREAASLVVAHLVGLGHRRIARLGGPADWAEETARAAGHAQALAERGLAAAARWRGDWSSRSGSDAAAAVAAAVRAPGGPTAVVAANDQLALGLVAGLKASGIRVPEDVSVTGFDDNPDAAFYRPALTTVRLDIVGEARRCVAQVLGEVRGQDAATLPLMPEPAAPELVVRASTAPPAS